MRLIDADALKRDICKYCNDVYSDAPCEPSDCEHMRIIDNQPAIDAVEVVRCKDCKYWDCYGGEDAHKGDCAELVGLDSCMYENDYCSYGERKTE